MLRCPAVQSLVVSAGDDKELQLPQNEITLMAYTVPKDSGTDYKYEWTLVAHPNEEQVGQMQDSNTASLHLTKVH